MNTEIKMKIKDILKERRSSKKMLVNKLGLKPITVGSYLTKMVNAEIIDVSYENKRPYYHLKK